ncbi:MAG TPA: bifunctional adenosylcobinamide kinase/adenosylcobinamide-phosphate guanylyltransferase [Candidatus Dormibacteraeota bacterium]
MSERTRSRTPLLLVLGGARSGKSAYAESRLVQRCGGDVLYVATMLPPQGAADPRIAAHRKRRPPQWDTTTVDGRGNIVTAVCERTRRGGLLVDGFELALALARPASDAAARAYATRSASACRATTADLVVVVGSEVGLGVHPETEAGLVFRDRVGAANQALAAIADEVVLVVAGLPLWVKGGPG